MVAPDEGVFPYAAGSSGRHLSRMKRTCGKRYYLPYVNFSLIGMLYLCSRKKEEEK